MAAYSFKNVVASISGPGGVIDLGMGSGAADEGISVERSEDRNTMQTGSDTHVMHSMHVADSGTIRVRLLKTSTTNGVLIAMFKSQRISSASWGRNQITIQDSARGDRITAADVAFTGEPTIAYGKVGAVQEWTFHAGHIEGTLDQGVPAAVV